MDLVDYLIDEEGMSDCSTSPLWLLREEIARSMGRHKEIKKDGDC